MSDPYRIDDPAPAAPRPREEKSGSALTILLWTIAAIFAGLNTAMSIAGQELIGAVFGGLGLLFVVIAVVRHLKRRRA